jgi:WD40 repeat protein
VQLLTGHDDRVVSVAFSSDGNRLVSSSGDATVIVWELETGAVVGQLLRNEFASQTQSVVFDPVDSGVIYAGGSGVYRWDLRPAIVERAACSIVGSRIFTTNEADRYLDGASAVYDCSEATNAR